MKSGFTGFPAEGLAFFRDLKENNEREWFQARKHIFDEKVKAPMFELIGHLNAAMMKFAPEYVTDPKDAIYRIYRDTRFSPDKTPYKTHIAASFPRRGMPRHASSGYYFSVSDNEIEIAGGVYMPGPEEMRAIRQCLAQNYEEYGRIISARPFKAVFGEVAGNKLSRVPKGFRADHPAADIIRGKQWYVYTTLDGSLAAGPDLLPEIIRQFKIMGPFVDFLNRPLLKSSKKPPAVLW